MAFRIEDAESHSEAGRVGVAPHGGAYEIVLGARGAAGIVVVNLPNDNAAHVHRFRDSHQREWRVFERLRHGLGGSETVLVFDCGVQFRCVHRYPANWHELMPDALERLSGQL